MNIEFEGEGVDEVGIVKSLVQQKGIADWPYHDNRIGFVGKTLVRIDPKYYRPTEVDLLLGDSTKIRNTLGWKPTVSVKELANEMVNEDLIEP